MTKYYVSLIGPFLGAYYPLPDNLETEAERRMACHTSRLKPLWCSIYTLEETLDQIGRFGGHILPDSFARKLDYDSHKVEMARPAAAPFEGRPGAL